MNRVTLALDQLATVWPRRLSGKKVGALLHAASVSASLRPTLSILEEMDASGQIRLSALFGPQHGFETTTQDNMIEWDGYRHSRLGLPVHSLYGEHREPTAAMLDGLEVILIDLMDVGARYYTFIWTMLLCLKAAERKGITVVVVDRPNPLNGIDVEGDPQHPDFLSFVGLHPLPVRHGGTIGELAKQFQSELFPGVDLEVLPMQGWNREEFYDRTGLPWVMPPRTCPRSTPPWSIPECVCLREPISPKVAAQPGPLNSSVLRGSMETPSLRDSMDSTCPEFCFGKLPLNPDFKNTPDRSVGAASCMSSTEPSFSHTEPDWN